MQLEKSPAEYREELDSQFKETEYSIRNEKYKRLKSVKSEKEAKLKSIEEISYKYVSEMEKSKLTVSKFAIDDLGGTIGCGTFIGLIVGVFVCWCCDDEDIVASFLTDVGSAFMFWLMFGFIGAILATILYEVSLKTSAKQAEKTNNSIATKISTDYSNKQEAIISINKEYDERVISIEKEFEEKIKKERESVDELYREYEKNFDNEAQKLSVTYTSSELVQEVVEWMTDGFIRTIECANRSNYVEIIEVPFEFVTYHDKISCNLGNFDFKTKNCENLNTILDRTAVARAIASAIQLKITMQLSNDASGTPYVLDISRTYHSSEVATCITYKASNGNFEVTRKWK